MSENFESRTLFHGDNLAFLRGMNSGTIDLIATDPPFNKNKDFHATPDSLASGASFQDRWRWDDDVLPEWLDQLRDDSPDVLHVIEGSRKSYGDDMGARLTLTGLVAANRKSGWMLDERAARHADHRARRRAEQVQLEEIPLRATA